MGAGQAYRRTHGKDSVADLQGACPVGGAPLSDAGDEDALQGGRRVGVRRLARPAPRPALALETPAGCRAGPPLPRTRAASSLNRDSRISAERQSLLAPSQAPRWWRGR